MSIEPISIAPIAPLLTPMRDSQLPVSATPDAVLQNKANTHGTPYTVEGSPLMLSTPPAQPAIRFSLLLLFLRYKVFSPPQ